MKSISIVNLKQSFKLETFRFVACLILSNWEQLTLNKWKTSDAEQHICLPAFMFLLFRFSFLKVRGLGTQNKLRLYFLYAKGNYKTWKQVMFTRDKGQESRLLGWGVPGIEKPTSHFSDCRETCQDRAHTGFRRPGKLCLEVLDVLLITVSTVLATCDQKWQRLRFPAGRALEASLSWTLAGSAFCNCLFSPVTAKAPGVDQCVCRSSPLLLVCTRWFTAKHLKTFFAGWVK